MNAMIGSMRDIRVLVIDDVEVTRNLVQGMLRKIGVGRIFASGNGREALDMMDSGAASVNTVLCDWNMPEMSGLDVLCALRGKGHGIPFIFLTGRNDAESIETAVRSGANGYILKPCMPEQLWEKLSRVHA